MTGQIITTRDTSNNATLRVDSIVNESVYYEAFCSNDIFTSLGLNGEFEIKDTIEFGTGGGRYFEYITFYPLEKKVTTYSASYTTSPANSKSYGTFYKVE